jgi:IS30 family transposase
MKKNYSHLSAEERAMIMIEHQRGTGVRTIARLLERSASTVSRELARNRDGSVPHYDATRAASAYRIRRERCVRRRKLAAGSALYQHVHDHLIYWRWSPQQIAARLRHMYPDEADERVSHETIYAAIYSYPRGGLKQAMGRSAAPAQAYSWPPAHDAGRRRLRTRAAANCLSARTDRIAAMAWALGE